jgi:hypothetical protein
MNHGMMSGNPPKSAFNPPNSRLATSKYGGLFSQGGVPPSTAISKTIQSDSSTPLSNFLDKRFFQNGRPKDLKRVKLQPPLGSYPDNMYMQHNQDVRLKPLKDIENYQEPAEDSRYYISRIAKAN